jgi:hypothetical protein
MGNRDQQIKPEEISDFYGNGDYGIGSGAALSFRHSLRLYVTACLRLPASLAFCAVPDRQSERIY